MTPLERYDCAYRWLYRVGIFFGIATGLYGIGAGIFGWPPWGWLTFTGMWCVTYPVWRWVARRRRALLDARLDELKRGHERENARLIAILRKNVEGS